MSDAVIFAENDDFVSIGDFERSLSWGAEIEFATFSFPCSFPT